MTSETDQILYERIDLSNGRKYILECHCLMNDKWDAL